MTIVDLYVLKGHLDTFILHLDGDQYKEDLKISSPHNGRDEDDQRQRISERTKIRGSNSHFFFPPVTFSYLKYLRTIFFQESIDRFHT